MLTARVVVIAALDNPAAIRLGALTKSGYPQVCSHKRFLVVIKRREVRWHLGGGVGFPSGVIVFSHRFRLPLTWTDIEHFEALFAGPSEWGRSNLQAEIWIPDGIPVEAFRNVYFRSDEDLEAALRACEPLAADLPRYLNFQVQKMTEAIDLAELYGIGLADLDPRGKKLPAGQRQRRERVDRRRADAVASAGS